MVDHVIRCLKEGRHVYAYVEGLNPEKIAEAAELPVDDVQQLLHALKRDQVPEIYRHVQNDSFVVIDELQNFWPSGRQKLSPEITEFVTEHGHRGLDLLCMGQSLADCHNLWRRRIENKICFMKLSAVGAEDRYRWTLYKQKSPDRWEEVTSGTEKYDSKYFGTYKSHEDGTNNKGNYKDARAVVWNHKGLRYGIPAALVAAGFALWHVVGLFGADSALAGSAKTERPQSQRSQPQRVSVEPVSVEETTINVLPDGTHQVTTSTHKPAAAATAPALQANTEHRLVPVDHISRISSAHKVRLAAVVHSSRVRVLVEWRDGSNRVMETLDNVDLQALGWQVMISATGNFAVLTNGQESILATSWPLDEVRGTVPAGTNALISSMSKSGG